MVLFTPKKLTFKGSKKQHQILAQTAYYQAGKIVVQTILPKQPPVALITLNTLGTTCSTSADTYIPIENIFNTQSCSFLESRLVSLYGGKAASLLIEYQQRFACPYIPSKAKEFKTFPLLTPSEYENPVSYKSSICTARVNDQFPFTPRFVKGPTLAQRRRDIRENLPVVADPSAGEGFEAGKTYKTETRVDHSELTLLQNSEASEWRAKDNAPTLRYLSKEHLVRRCFAGAGNNIFQSTLGNIEIQTATRLARIMVNYWNFYSLNNNSSNKLFQKFPLGDNPLAVAVKSPYAITKINVPTIARVNHYSASDSIRIFQRNMYNNYSSAQTKRDVPNLSLLPIFQKGKYWQKKKELAKENELTLAIAEKTTLPLYFARSATARGSLEGGYLPMAKPLTEAEGDAKRKYNVREWNIKLKVKDKIPQRILSLEKILAKRIAKKRIFSANQSYTPLGSAKKRKYLAKRNDAVIKTNIIYKVQNNFYFAIAQSKNSLKIYENNNSSYNIQRLSVTNIGNYSQRNNNNFQLINSLQFSNLQRDRFYPNWFRLYLPDMEATEFLKNVANYYFSLGLQTLTFPSTKSSYYFTPLGYSEGIYVPMAQPLASPFLTFLNTQKVLQEKQKLFISNIISYTYCPPSILINSTSDKSINSRFATNNVVIKDLLEEQITLLCKTSASDYYKLYPRFTKDVSFNLYNFISPRNPCANLTIPIPPRGKCNKVRRSDVSLPFVQESIAAQLRKLFAKRGVHYLDNLQETKKDFVQSKRMAQPLEDEEIKDFPLPNLTLQKPRVMISDVSEIDYIKNPSFTKVVKDQLDPLNVPFSLLLENQIFPFNYNGFSIIEKELLYNALVNSSFAKAFYLINQNRQLLDFLVDYLLRFQILRQHQILYLFSTLLLGCNKTKTI